jgi:hypothetical protein
MAARTRVLQLAIALVNLSLIALAFTSIWPFPHGDFKVHLPQARDVTWSYQNGMVHVSAPYSIDNGGFYDVDDLVITYSVTNNTRYLLAGDTFDLGKIPKGSIHHGALDFTFDLLGFYRNGTQWMIFNDDILNFDIHVSCYYTMRLVKFDASYSTGVAWDALIRSWAVNATQWPPPLPTPGVPYPINYWLNTSMLLSGLPPAHLNVSISKDGQLLGWGLSDIQLGGDQQGVVNVNLIPGVIALPGDILTFSYQISVMEYPIAASWNYTIPGGLP